MQLFAIIAKVNRVEDGETLIIESPDGRKIIEAFLRPELSASLVKKYLDLFDEFLLTHHDYRKRKGDPRKRTSLNSVKVLRISNQINRELTQRQKIIVLLRVLEFIYSGSDASEQEKDFARMLAESFNIGAYEFETIRKQVMSDVPERIDFQEFLYIGRERASMDFAHTMQLDHLEGIFRVLFIKSVNTIIFRYFGTDELNMNGRPIASERNHIVNPGSAFRTSRTRPVYYSDIVSRFLNDTNKEKIVLEAQSVSYRFGSGKEGLHRVSLKAHSGELVGLMGASGSGKTTLINVLSGSQEPAFGSVSINNIDVHGDNGSLEGVIGFISQDDLLIEELTVFQNLYYNTQLCFGHLDKKQITKKVTDLLISIGLQDVMHLKVGSPLSKTISGGQRKRLNIAMELIREPSVLFVDEPTSGLSSRDSENIMDMLKELVLKGKLVFVVIHQPSSDIFKMFDKLLILDHGYPIFEGNPIDAVVYFKTCVHHVNASERECVACGNVNPEQIFNIIEARVVDEYGNAVGERRISPKEWYERYLTFQADDAVSGTSGPPRASARIPGRWRQFSVFFRRDILSKLANRQYVLVNLLEAPFLAFFLAFFVKYSNGGEGYTFSGNENLPQYLFIAVVVALFLGMTVAAEEIIKDKRILKRESFLNLSRRSYLFSKLAILFLISAVQTLCFVLIGNLLLGIRGMWLEYWVVLFTVSCAANVIGLNISSALNSLKVIYITVPVLIIPQLLFSGAIVKFDKLHPVFSHPVEVPFIGNIMISRWASEALAVTQARHNRYMSEVYDLEKARSINSWKRDYWIPEMENRVSILFDPRSSARDFSEAQALLVNEIRAEEGRWADLSCTGCEPALTHFDRRKPSLALHDEVRHFLDVAKKHYHKTYMLYAARLEAFKSGTGSEALNALRRDHHNESIMELVTNQEELDKIVEADHRLFQKSDPIYQQASGAFFKAPMYVPSKLVLGIETGTLIANLLVIWLMTAAGIVILYYDLLRKALVLLAALARRSRRRERPSA